MRASAPAVCILFVGACQSISETDSTFSSEQIDASSYTEARREAWSARRAVRLPIRWHPDGSACWIGGAVDQSFGLNGIDLQKNPPDTSSTRARQRPIRGRQFDTSTSPDGLWKAVSRNGNIFLEGVDDERSQVVTSEGTSVLKYGTASWVYGEELDVQEAMWWRGDSQGLVYYRFNESDVPQYPLTRDMTSTRPRLTTEAYPKPGDPNPVADLECFDLATGERWLLPTQPSQTNDEPWYIFGVTPHREHEMLFHRTDRRQQIWELVWVDLSTRTSRVVLSETQSCWHENNPQRRFLSDGITFLHQSQQSGWLAWQLCSLDPNTDPVSLTPPGLVAGDIVSLDESSRRLRFMGANQPNFPLHQQLFEVPFDGSSLTCLTPDPGHHSISHAPVGNAFVATHQSVEMAPEIRLHATNDEVHVLHSRSSFDQHSRLAKSELVSTKVGDTQIYGVLHLPVGHGDGPFPLLVDVYGGPHSRGFDPRFEPVRGENILGIATLKIASRGTTGQSKAFQNDVYGKLGQVDLGDQAALAAAISRRPDIDNERLGIFGFSYGGYMSALGLIKHPDVFRFGVSGAPVVDWRYYDSIYTERYMGLLSDNEPGYDAGSCMTHVSKDAIGKMLLIHGAVDDNVHVSNAFALMDSLHEEQHPFELMIYPEAGHGLPRDGSRRMWDFLLRHCFP